MEHKSLPMSELLAAIHATARARSQILHFVQDDRSEDGDTLAAMTTPAVPLAPDDSPSITRRRRWRGRARPPAMPQGDWPELIARLLALRGVTDGDAARALLEAPGAIPDPYVLPALDTAIARLLRAVETRETVAIFGDFDVDGVTSAAQLA